MFEHESTTNLNVIYNLRNGHSLNVCKHSCEGCIWHMSREDLLQRLEQSLLVVATVVIINYRRIHRGGNWRSFHSPKSKRYPVEGKLFFFIWQNFFLFLKYFFKKLYFKEKSLFILKYTKNIKCS